MTEAGAPVVDVAVAGLRAPSLDIDPMIVLKPFVTKAYEQKVKSRTVGEEPSNTPDYVLQQARQAHGRNMLDLCNPADVLRQRVANTTSLVRLQNEDYLRQRNALLEDDEDDEDDNDGDNRGGKRTAGGAGSGSVTSPAPNLAAGSRTAGVSHAGAEDVPQIVQIHRRSDGDEDGDEDDEKCKGAQGVSAALAAIIFTPNAPAVAPGNSRADDLLNRYRQFDRASAGSGSFSLGAPPAAGEMSVRAGRPHLMSYVPISPSFNRESLGRTYSKPAAISAPDALRASEQRSPRSPLAQQELPTVDSPGGGGALFQSTGANASVRRARSSSQGLAASVREAPLRGSSCTSLMRPGGGPATSPTGAGADGSTRPAGAASEQYSRSSRVLAVLLEQPAAGGAGGARGAAQDGDGRAAGCVSSPSALSPVSYGAGDKSVQARRGIRATAASTGGAGSFSAQQATSLVAGRASEPSIRPFNGHGGGSGLGGVNSRSGADSETGSGSPQLPDLGATPSPAAAALFRAITGVDAVGRAPLDVPERSCRSFRGPSQSLQQQLLQQQFLNGQAAGALTGVASSEGTQSLRARNTTSNLELGVQKSGSSIGKLPRIGPSSLSFTSSPTGTAQSRSSPHSLKRTSGEDELVGYLTASSRMPAGGAGQHAVDGRHRDEAGIVSKVKGLLSILKR